MMPKKKRPETLSEPAALAAGQFLEPLDSSADRPPADAGGSDLSHVPASAPLIVVTIAGMVESRPSGSYTLPNRQMCGSVMMIRSMYAARLHALSLMVVISQPGTGTIVMMNQYPR